jgi:AcrR family transcriptional regulator
VGDAAPGPVLNPPLQARSRAAFERVLDAGTEVLREGGFEAFTITEVSRRAKVSVGSIYGRANKEGLLLAIHARWAEQISEEQDALLRALEPARLGAEELVRAAVAAVAQVFRDHGDLLHVFMIRGSLDATIRERGAEASARNAETFERMLLSHREAITHPDPELAVDVAFRLVYSTFARRVMRGDTFESRRPLPWDRLVDELGEVSVRYLLRS